jgi:hypothetical protein
MSGIARQTAAPPIIANRIKLKIIVAIGSYTLDWVIGILKEASPQAANRCQIIRDDRDFAADQMPFGPI